MCLREKFLGLRVLRSPADYFKSRGGGVLLLRPRRGDGKKIERKNVLKVMQTYGL